MVEPIMKKVAGDGVEINLAEWEGTGKPILCVHGITANCRCWDVLASALVPQYHVMAMDLRGRGRSDKPDTGYALNYHIRDINSLLDNLNIDQAVIIGHSLGAFIGLAFAAQYPDRADSRRARLSSSQQTCRDSHLASAHASMQRGNGAVQTHN